MPIFQYSNWNQLSVNTMTNLFLYGTENTPANHTDRLRTTAEYQDEVIVELQMDSYMTTGAGRYAHPSMATFVQDFFNLTNQINLPPDRYTKAQLIANHGYSEDDFKFAFKHYDIDSSSADYTLRTYIYNSAGYEINDDAVFVIENTGSGNIKYVENMSVHAFQDNFDFESDNPLTQIGNDFFLGDEIDPYNIGRTVTIKLEDKENVQTYEDLNSGAHYDVFAFQADETASANENNGNIVIDALPAMINVVADLEAAGVIDNSIYGTNGGEVVKIEGDEGNIVAIVGGEGEDTVDYTGLDSYLDNDVTVNLETNSGTIEYVFEADDTHAIYDIQHVKTGNGNDAVTGDSLANEIQTNDGNDVIESGDGDDTIDSGDGNDIVRGGFGADSIEGGLGNDWLHANDSGSTLDTDGDYLDGGDGDDWLYGDSANDTLVGGIGDDLLVSKGNSILKGGAGLDYYTAKAGDVIIDADGGRFNGASFIQGGEHIWHAGTTIHPFKVFGNTLYVYTGGLQTAPSDTYFTIQNFSNDGRWGFTIPQEYYDAKNEFVTDIAGDESPDENVNPEGGSTTLSNPTNGHPNENPSAGSPTLNTDDTNQNENGYLNHTSYLKATIGFDTQNGGDADDVYEWGTGFHDDILIDAGGSDTIKMLNLNEADVTLEQVGDDIVITAINSTELEELTIQGHYLATGAVESIEFADGSTLGLGLSSTGHTNAIEYIENMDVGVNDTVVAMGGNDTIRSWDGNDSIDAGAGDDSVHAGDGNDTVFGGTGNDNIHTGLDNDSVDGGDGDDYIYGADGMDTITGGAGADTLHGYLGDDVYIWGVGDGDDVIEESGYSGGGNDTLKLIGGITLADLDIFGSSGWHINVVYIPTGEHITLSKMFFDIDRMIETITFDDGSTYNLDQAVEWRGGDGDDYINASYHDDTLSGNALNDTLDSGHGNDTLIGGAGDDWLYGDAGDDVYVWASGDGNDTIQEDPFEANSGNDKIEMIGGITAADLDVYGIVGGSIMITYLPTSETITVNSQFVDVDYRVENIVFDDGTLFDLVNGINNWFGTSGNDNLTGTSNDETYVGEAGNDSIRGRYGDDTLEGGLGDDTLKGENDDDWLTGGLGDDYVLGGSGNDTYFWASGDGNDEIYESSGTDTLKMTGGITAADLTFVGGASQNLLITYTPTGEVITVKDHHYHSYQDYRIETLEFDDGSTYSLLEGVEWFGSTGNDTLKAGKYDDTITGDAGNDKIYGYAGNDSIIGGTGNDSLYGYEGDDTYVWQSGDGNDTIQELSSNGGMETLLMTGGIVATDVTFTDSGNHLIITHAPTGETITIRYQNYYDSDYHVETLAFDDGSTVDLLGV